MYKDTPFRLPKFMVLDKKILLHERRSGKSYAISKLYAHMEKVTNLQRNLGQ